MCVVLPAHDGADYCASCARTAYAVMLAMVILAIALGIATPEGM